MCVCVLNVGGRKPKSHQPASNGSFDLGIKKRQREGKGLYQLCVKLTACSILTAGLNSLRRCLCYEMEWEIEETCAKH